MEHIELYEGQGHLRIDSRAACGFTPGLTRILKGKGVGNASGDPVGGAVVKTRWRHPVRLLVMKPSPQSREAGKGLPGHTD